MHRIWYRAALMVLVFYSNNTFRMYECIIRVFRCPRNVWQFLDMSVHT